MDETETIKLNQALEFIRSRTNKYGELHLTGRETDTLITQVRRLVGGVMIGQQAVDLLKEIQSEIGQTSKEKR